MKMKFLSIILFFVTLQVYAQPEKVVLIEGTTGTWGPYCPRGIVYANELHANYPGQYIFVAIHFDDPMEYLDYMAQTGLIALPLANIDRAYESSMDPYEQLTNDMEGRLAVTPPANISVTTNWDESTREISMTVSATMFEDLSGDYRLAAIVTEDSVTGPSPAYDQSNIFSGSGNGPMGGYENLPDPIPASLVVYNHVARNLPGGYEGDENSMPSELVNGQVYSFNYSYTLPEEFDETYIRVAGIMVNGNTGEILNAGGSPYISGYENAPPVFQSNPITEVYLDTEYNYNILVQDPDYDDLTITTASILPAGLSLIAGENGMANLVGSPTEEGVFEITLNATDGNWDVEQTFELTVIGTTEIWLFVGEEAFSAADIGVSQILIQNNGTPIAMAVDQSGSLQMYELNGDLWGILGATLPVSWSNVSICLDNDGNPVAYDGMGKVFRLTDGNWMQIGGNLPDVNNIYSSVAVDANNNVHVVYCLPPNATVGYYYDGSSWVSSGNISENYSVWNQLKIDNEGNPMVIFGTDGSNTAYSEIASWDGNTWNLLGGGYIDPNELTYYDHDFTITPNGDIYAALTVSVQDHKLNIYKLVGGTWEMISDDLNNGPTAHVRIDSDSEGNVIVAYRDENEGGRTSSKMLVDNQWINLGLPGFTNPASNQSLAVDNSGVPYVLFHDENNQSALTCKKFANINTSVFNLSSLDQNLLVYPNPSTGMYTLKLDAADRFDVYDVNGKVIMSQKLPHHFQQLDINLSKQPAGIYLLRVQNGDKSSAVKLIKE